MKEIHFWFRNDYPEKTLHTYHDTSAAIEAGRERIDTTQIVLCSTRLFEKGYRVFVMPYIGNEFELKLGEQINGGRQLRANHNLVRLLTAGEFDDIVSTDVSGVIGLSI